jgi:hypothetical protein
MGVDDVEAVPAQERADRPQRARVLERPPEAAVERQPGDRDARVEQPRVDQRVARARDRRLPSVAGKAQRELVDVLRDAPVRGLVEEQAAPDA